jgi:hypothetical protein
MMFTFNQHHDIIDKALQDYRNTLRRPTRQDVQRNIVQREYVNAIEIIAFFVLFVVGAWTAFKVTLVAIPTAEYFVEVLTQGYGVSEVVKGAFTLTTILMFILLSTFSLIYFKLLDEQVTAAGGKWRARRWSDYFTLTWITPHLPSIMVYFTVAWLVVLSSSPQLYPLTVFERYLPIIAEVALAYVVGNILHKRSVNARVVTDALTRQLNEYERKWQKPQHEVEYKKALYSRYSEAIKNLRVRDNEDRRKFIYPYNNITEEEMFALVNEAYRSYKNLTMFEVDAEEAAAAAAGRGKGGATKLVPNGANWQPRELAEALVGVGAVIENERHLKDFVSSDYGHIKAWRGGGRRIYKVLTKRKS